MRKILFILFLFFTLVSNANEAWVEKVKNYNLTFGTKDINELNIINKYGNIQIIHWEKKQVKADVVVKANAPNNALTEKYLNSIHVKSNVKNNVINIITSIDQNISPNTGNRAVSYLTVNYIIYMPKELKLTIDNSFGSINLPEIFTQLDLNLNHGSLKAPLINNNHSNVNLKFSTAVINELIGGTLTSVNSNVNLLKAKKADIKGEKGILVADMLEDIKAELYYTKTTFNELGKDIELDLSFINDLKLGNLNSDLKQLKISTNYTDVQLPVNAAFKTSFNVQATNGQLYIGQGIPAKIKKDAKASTAETKVFEAIIGDNGKTQNTLILIKSVNGDVKIKK